MGQEGDDQNDGLDDGGEGLDEVEAEAARRRFEVAERNQVHTPRIREFLHTDKRGGLPLYKAKEGCLLQCRPDMPKGCCQFPRDWHFVGRAILALQKVSRGKMLGCCNMYGEDGKCCHVLDDRGYPFVHCDQLMPGTAEEIDRDYLEKRMEEEFTEGRVDIVYTANSPSEKLDSAVYAGRVRNGEVDAVKINGKGQWLYVKFHDKFVGRMARMVFLDSLK